MQAPLIPGFTYIDTVGEGGFADVFRYQQELPTRQVAIKVLRSTGNAAGLELFKAEANVMAQLSSHPSIVPIFQAGVSADGRAFLVMEYCPPPHLAQRFRRQPLAVAEVLDIGIKIAAAVETAHRAGVLHRDIKPHNILTSSFGAPLLADFGIAAVIGEKGVAGQGLSIPWSPPEVLIADSHDVRSDVYSLAGTLYSLLAGHSPCEIPGGDNDNAKLMARIDRGQVTPMTRTDVPPSLLQLLRRAMAVRITDRPVSALELGRLLQDVQIEIGQPPTRLEVMDAAPTGQAEQAVDDLRTMIRPVSVIIPPAVGARLAPLNIPAAEGTVFRGQLADADSESLPTGSVRRVRDEPERRMGTLGKVVTGVVAAAVIGGVGYVVLTGGGSDDDRHAQQIDGEGPADPVAIDDTPDPPTVTLTGSGARWTFHWRSGRPRTGDEYKVLLSGDGIEHTDPDVVPNTSESFTIARNKTICVQVAVKRGNATSGLSEPRCAVGQ